MYAATFALYCELVAREGARIERKTPGIIDATRRVTWMTCASAVRRNPRSPAVTFRDGLEDTGVPIDWQVERLERFVAELRSQSIAAGASA